VLELHRPRIFAGVGIMFIRWMRPLCPTPSFNLPPMDQDFSVH
jgi:hypothetical protein